MIDIKDEPGLVRDPVSKAIQNTDLFALQEHRRKKLQTIEQINRLNNLEKDFEEVRLKVNRMEEILIAIHNKIIAE